MFIELPTGRVAHAVQLVHISCSLKVCMNREELELLTDIRDFSTLFYVILRRESSEWLESSIDLGMRFAIKGLDLAFHNFAVLRLSF